LMSGFRKVGGGRPSSPWWSGAPCLVSMPVDVPSGNGSALDGWSLADLPAGVLEAEVPALRQPSMERLPHAVGNPTRASARQAAAAPDRLGEVRCAGPGGGNRAEWRRGRALRRAVASLPRWLLWMRTEPGSCPALRQQHPGASRPLPACWPPLPPVNNLRLLGHRTSKHHSRSPIHPSIHPR